jgi:DNA (cytosine-5)-methyltransferase 1
VAASTTPRRRADEDGRTYGVKLVRGPFVRLPAHPEACETEADLIAMSKKRKRPLAADLFCGAGGLSLGLADAGFDVILAVDHDDEALETHRANHPGLSVNWDLGKPEVVEKVAQLITLTGVQLVAGGPPCQPFSRAGRSMVRELVRTGKRHHHDERRDLWESFLGVIELSRPEAVLMENVPDMALDRGMVILRTMVERLEAWGYSVEERVVDTWRYGVPQFRQRLILVALRDGVAFTWPGDASERVTVDNAIGDLPVVEGGWRPDNGDGDDPVASGWASYTGPVTQFQARARNGVAPVDSHRIYDHITRPVREDDAIAFSQMDAKTRYSDLAPSLKRYRDDIFDDKYKRLDPNDVSRTITAHIAKDGYWYIHPYQDRTLTVREAARLQTFPDSVRFAGPPSSAFRQIGNAVPPALGRHIGLGIRSSLTAGERSVVSTKVVANTLADWFRDREATRVPWLEASNRWSVIQAEILWSRIAEDVVASAWRAVRHLTSPAETLDAIRVLRALARQWGREARCDQLEETAQWFSQREDLLESSKPADDLVAAPHVTQAIADLAVRIVPGDAEDPVLAGYGVLRVAARFQGDLVDRQNRLSDGRLALARMIGGEDASHDAHLALIELANGYCGRGIPECSQCPLEPWCVEARERPLQRTLEFSDPAAR